MAKKKIDVDISTPEKQLELLSIIVDLSLNGIQTEAVTPKGTIVTYTLTSLRDAIAAIKLASQIMGSQPIQRTPIRITVDVPKNITALLEQGTEDTNLEHGLEDDE
jgi:hypothetical protein